MLKLEAIAKHKPIVPKVHNDTSSQNHFPDPNVTKEKRWPTARAHALPWRARVNLVLEALDLKCPCYSPPYEASAVSRSQLASE